FNWNLTPAFLKTREKFLHCEPVLKGIATMFCPSKCSIPGTKSGWIHTYSIPAGSLDEILSAIPLLIDDKSVSNAPSRMNCATSVEPSTTDSKGTATTTISDALASDIEPGSTSSSFAILRVRL